MEFNLLLDIWGVLAGALFLALLAWVSFTDIKKRIIPNQAVLVLLVLGLLNLLLAVCQSQIWWQYPVGTLIALPFLFTWLRGLMGAGDVKLILVCGLFLGLLASIAMVGLMLIILVGIAVYLAIGCRSIKTRIPLGPVIAAAAAIANIQNMICVL